MDIKIYSTSTCPYCIMAKKYFSSRGLTYQDLDVSKDKAAADAMVKVSGQMGVPVILINGEIIIGFNKSRIESIIGK